MTTELSVKDKQNILKLCDCYKQIYPAAVSDVLDQMGYENNIVYGSISRMITGRGVLCGPAATIRGTGAWGPNLPERTNPDSSEPVLVTFFRSLEQGQVAVFGTDIWDKVTVIGDVMSTAMQSKGAAGAVVDGYIRDCDRITALEWPVYAKGIGVRAGGARLSYLETDCPIQIGGGVLVRPWDIILGDRDGLVVIPKEKAEVIYEEAKKVCESEAGFIEKLIKLRGSDLDETFIRYLTK